MRLANAIVSIVAYVGKELVRETWRFFYPFPTTIAAGTVVAAAVRLAGISAAAWFFRRRHPYVLAGWLWFLAALLPNPRADPGGRPGDGRPLHLSSRRPGLAVACVWLAAALARPRPVARLAAVAGGTAVILALLPITRAQVEVWRDGDTLFSHALRATRDNWHIEHEFGVLLFNGKRYAEAETHLREAVRPAARPRPGALQSGGSLFWQGRPAEAVAEYREVIRVRPDFAEAHFRLARALAYQGNEIEALPEYEETLRLEPGHAAAAAGRRKALAAIPHRAEVIAGPSRALTVSTGRVQAPSFRRRSH